MVKRMVKIQSASECADRFRKEKQPRVAIHCFGWMWRRTRRWLDRLGWERVPTARCRLPNKKELTNRIFIFLGRNVCNIAGYLFYLETLMGAKLIKPPVFICFHCKIVALDYVTTAVLFAVIMYFVTSLLDLDMLQSENIASVVTMRQLKSIVCYLCLSIDFVFMFVAAC